ncbi:DUF3786 domain-containing protein [Clostridium formicaceticum]|uniref:DUF3786 domain-containing protein n=1 Tax=Clostridium formicaceticum TaxID=1497 RepID=A0AAC9RM52_9CLOT|nr:DUF3786 domain-containing protein [Clostridium formicaceticum]AOY76416.1 hypothetical protein BJL90_11160 [Clostridium formicaceticum]ARE86810.1 hypothetical protein CLFO_11410 [Clostridium formicaceticum]
MDIQAVKEDRQGKVPYEYIRNIYKDCDPVEMAELSGTLYQKDKKFFTVKMMEKNYLVTYPAGEVIVEESNEKVGSYAIKTIFLRYLVNAKGIPPTNKSITYKEIPGGHVYYSNFYNRTILKLAKIYGNDIEAFHTAAEKIGAERINIGDGGYRFRFLNNVYVTFILWQGDEEVSASANILFDLNASYYFDAEDLAVVGEAAVDTFKGHGVLPSWKGLYEKQPFHGQYK